MCNRTPFLREKCPSHRQITALSADRQADSWDPDPTWPPVQGANSPPRCKCVTSEEVLKWHVKVPANGWQPLFWLTLLDSCNSPWTVKSDRHLNLRGAWPWEVGGVRTFWLDSLLNLWASLNHCLLPPTVASQHEPCVGLNFEARVCFLVNLTCSHGVSPGTSVMGKDD